MLQQVLVATFNVDVDAVVAVSSLLCVLLVSFVESLADIRRHILCYYFVCHLTVCRTQNFKLNHKILIIDTATRVNDTLS